MENPECEACFLEAEGGLGTPKVQLASEVRAVLLGTTPSNLWGLS